MKRVVLTGGPCAGKSTVLAAIATYLPHLVEIVPEAASHAFAGGYPLPEPDWSDQDWYALQMIITYQQLRFEAEAEARAKESGKEIIVCDRAPYDNLAYRMGREAVAELVGPELTAGMRRYDLVIHLRSLAVIDPPRYQQTSNAGRYESLSAATFQEAATIAAWSPHPNRVTIAETDINELVTRSIALICRRRLTR